MSEPQDQYLHALRLPVTLGGNTFEAVVHLGLVKGRTACVGVEVRSFELLGYDRASQTYEVGEPDAWVELTARRLREVRLEELTENARQDMLEWLESQSLVDPGWLARTKDLYQRPSREGRPGRPAHLPDDLIASLVADTYQAHIRRGGSSPVIAVRDAVQEALDARKLPDAFVPADGTRDRVSIYQARALVRRARRLGLLPDAPRSPQRGK